jgi:hypothetical protein
MGVYPVALLIDEQSQNYNQTLDLGNPLGDNDYDDYPTNAN